MSIEVNAGRDAGCSRRRALQSAGAALITADGIAEHAPDAVAQSPAGSPAVPATPTIPADFKVVLHAAEVQNWPYVLPITIPTAPPRRVLAARWLWCWRSMKDSLTLSHKGRHRAWACMRSSDCARSSTPAAR